MSDVTEVVEVEVTVEASTKTPKSVAKLEEIAAALCSISMDSAQAAARS